MSETKSPGFSATWQNISANDYVYPAVLPIVAVPWALKHGLWIAGGEGFCGNTLK